MADKIEVGMIGAGVWANKVHYPSLAGLDDVTMAAVCDLDEDRLADTANRYDIGERFRDYRRMLKEIDLDAVYVIMSPVPTNHYQNADPLVDVVTHCLRENKNVFIEKPPGVNVEETRRMAREAAANNCRTMVGFNRRFIPIAREARRIVEEKGPVTHCTATFHKNQIAQPKAWGKVDHLTADVIHAVDALRWMSGDEPEKTASHVESHYSDCINSYNALVVFGNGCVGHLNSCYSAGGRVHRFEMHAKGVSAYVNLPLEVDRQEALILQDNQPFEKVQIIRSPEFVGSAEFHKCYGYYQENRHFIDCVKKDEEPETNFEDALKTMELVERIKESTIHRL